MLKRTLALFLCLLLSLGAAQAATLTVRGDGAVSIKADRAEIVIGVRANAADAIEAQQTVNACIQAICEAMLNLGLKREDIVTNAISLYPNTIWLDSGEQRIDGYNASNSLSITTGEIDGVGGIVDAAFSAGANELQHVRFSAADTQAARDEALKLAVADALAKAQLIAVSSGLELDEIVSINEAGDGDPANALSARSMVMMEEDAGEGTMVSAGALQVTASVVLTIEAD